ncbi:MAG: dihydrodipicolinate synthase family protein [Armatimonadetes bacterium]|nr:dihydrodipicolinate synthase family protein [Armatimonadota bacterium]
MIGKEKSLTGIVVATLTPYEQDGRVDYGLAREHVAWLVEAGISVVAPVGTTGEFLYLSEEEKAALVRAAVAGAGGRARVIAGIWARDPAEVRRLGRAAADAGADAVYLTTPIYYPHSDDSLYRWYANARAATPLPLLCYNIPQYARNELSVSLVERLVAGGIVEGIKDSTGKEERLMALLAAVGKRTLVYGASDSFALRSRHLGAHGFVSALANIYPRAFLRIWQRDASAQAAIDRIRAAVKGYGGIAGLKHLLARRGFPFGDTRLPFSELSPAGRTELDRILADLGELD